MRKSKLVFLAKSDQLKLFMLLLLLLVYFFTFKEAAWPLEADDAGWRFLFALCASLPFALYFCSGKSVTVDLAKKTAQQVYVLMKIPVSSPKRGTPIREIFLIPEVSSSLAESESKEVWYSVCAGEFASIQPDRGRSRPKPGVSRRPENYFVLRGDMASFKKAEAKARDLAERLEAPARIYWGEINSEAAAESKAGADLSEPFKEPEFVQELEREGTLMEEIHKKREARRAAAAGKQEQSRGRPGKPERLRGQAGKPAK